jgi:hypothetical protein
MCEGDLPATDAALAMLAMVAAVAANGHRLAGILAAPSAGVWSDFFLTQPYERFTITRRGDIETTVLLLVIGVAVTEIAVRGRRQQATASRHAGYIAGISSVAQAVVAGGSPSALIEQFTQLLSLRMCRFQHGVADVGHLARLRHDGDGHRGRPSMGGGRRGVPGRQGHRAAAGERRRVPSPFPVDPAARRESHPQAAPASHCIRCD